MFHVYDPMTHMFEMRSWAAIAKLPSTLVLSAQSVETSRLATMPSCESRSSGPEWTTGRLRDPCKKDIFEVFEDWKVPRFLFYLLSRADLAKRCVGFKAAIPFFQKHQA